MKKLRMYWVQTSSPPFPSKGYTVSVFRSEPTRDQLSPNLVCLWQVEAESAADAKICIMIPGKAKLLI